MNYPIPNNRDIFSTISLFTTEQVNKSTENKFSWNRKGSLMSDFLVFLKKWSWLYPAFPFVKEIYLANSITFNALKPTSDIDLFVVTKSHRIRIARFLMSIMLMFFNLKRGKKSEFKKFCLSFFVDEDHTYLEPLLLHEKDIYFPYWIAHLVPLYQEQRSDTFYRKNGWIPRFLPNLPLGQNIYLGLACITGKSLFKLIIESIFIGKFGDRVEQKISYFWGKRIRKLKLKNPAIHQGVVVKDGILKFYYDKRQAYSDLYFS